MKAPGDEFGAFLYASIGEEKNGMSLSVLSALARLDLDPWKQAMDWSRLPQQAASQKLAAVIAALPEGAASRPPPEVIAARLVALLPPPQYEPGIAPSSWAQGMRARWSDAASRRNFIFLLIILSLGVQWLASRSNTPEPGEQTPRAHSAPVH